MSYIKINGEVINTDCVNFIKYDDTNFRIMIYTDDIYNLSYVIDGNKTEFDDEKKKIWYLYMRLELEREIDVHNWDRKFDRFYTKNHEQDIITDEEIE